MRTKSLPKEEVLTVGRMVEYLKTLDQGAKILAFDEVTNEYVTQLPDIPNHAVSSVRDDKTREEKILRAMYWGIPGKDGMVRRDMESIYKNASDGDVIFRF